MVRKILRLSEDITMFQAFDILCYDVGQLYKSHYHAFNPAEYSPQKYQRGKVSSFIYFNHGTMGLDRICRFASFLFLSGVEDRGKTMFPFENGMNMDGSYGFKGDGLLFDSMFPNLTIDPGPREK